LNDDSTIFCSLQESHTHTMTIISLYIWGRGVAFIENCRVNSSWYNVNYLNAPIYSSGTSPTHGHLQIPTVKIKYFVVVALKFRKVADKERITI